MTLQTQHTANAPATLTDEQRRRVADALEKRSIRRTPAGTMPASTGSSVTGVNAKSSQRCRLSQR